MDLSGKFPVRMLEALEELSQQLHALGLYATACDDEATANLLRDLSDRLEAHRHADLFARQDWSHLLDGIRPASPPAMPWD